MATDVSTRPARVRPAITSRRGGVSAIPRMPALVGSEILVEPSAASPAAATFPNFAYHGGPVIGCPFVYASFWGSGWTSNPALLTRAGHLTQFLSDLLASPYMNVLSQYGVGFGAGLAGAFIRASFVSGVPTTLTESSIQQTIQSCIDAGVLPESSRPANVTLMIFLDEGIGINSGNLVLCEPSGDTAFGYHSFFTTRAGNPYYYAMIPALSDTCLTESCGSNDAGCSLHHSETQEARITQVTSHEFAEMVTDPELNAWYDSSGSENGDICNGESDTITVGSNSWTIQRQYSKTDDQTSNGATYCVVGAAHPESKLSPGPTARPAKLAHARRMPPIERMLPLPPVHFDLGTKAVRLEPADLHAYLGGVFYPSKPSEVMPDLAGFLRQAADALKK